jgi:ABC-type branched-subunit amino acid transport system substrate-binding protein
MISLFYFALSDAQTYQIGGMYTCSYHDGRYADWGALALRGAQIAIEEINESGLLGADRMEMKDENVVDYHCWPEGADSIAEDLFKRDIIAITGVDCSDPAVRISKVAEKYKKPAISYGANAAILTSSIKFPFFFRVVTPSSAYERYLIEIAAKYGLKRLALFYTTEAWGIGACSIVQNAVMEAGLEVIVAYGYPRDTPLEVVERHMAEVKAKGIRNIFITMPTPDTVIAFRALAEQDMNQRGYAIFASEMTSADETPDIVTGALGYFAPMTKLYPSAKLAAFRAKLEKRLGHSIDPNSKLFFYAVLAYDHILAVGHALKDAKDADEKAINGEVLMNYLRNVDFEGASGRINLSPGTNDRALMAVEIMNCHGYKEDGKTVDFVPVGFVDPLTGKLTLDESKILWPGRTTTPPKTE